MTKAEDENPLKAAAAPRRSKRNQDNNSQENHENGKAKVYTEGEIKAMTVAKLKELCIKHEIAVEKTKKDLVKKVTEFFIKTNAMKQEEAII